LGDVKRYNYLPFVEITAANHEDSSQLQQKYETKKTNYKGWNFNSGNYLFTTDTK